MRKDGGMRRYTLTKTPNIVAHFSKFDDLAKPEDDYPLVAIHIAQIYTDAGYLKKTEAFSYEKVGDDRPDKSNIWFNMAISWSDFISRPSDTSSGRQTSTLLTLVG